MPIYGASFRLVRAYAYYQLKGVVALNKVD